MLCLALLLAVPPPAFVDDEAVRGAFVAKLAGVGGRCLPADRLGLKVQADRTAVVPLAGPPTARLEPEDVAAAARPGVLVFGSIVTVDGKPADNRMATAWALTADGVVVTSRHVLEDPEADERFGALTSDGRCLPVVDVLAVDRAGDVAVVKLGGGGLTPLPVARAAPRVGGWVGVFGHPGDRYWTFTQGHVSRYAAQTRPDGLRERWMGITADYAFGSSGSPVVDRTGAVVGMAALTEALDFPVEEPPADKPRGQPDPGSRLQMVVKLATPLAALRRAVGAD
jgi:S1-C subfamily serine protease